jgi:hypothetical protein
MRTAKVQHARVLLSVYDGFYIGGCYRYDDAWHGMVWHMLVKT